MTAPAIQDTHDQRRTGARRQRRAGCVYALSILVAVALTLTLSRSLWLPLFGRFLIVSDPLRSADAVVALAGGRERIPPATVLLKTGHADWFVVTAMPLNVPGVRESFAELATREAVWQGVPEAQVLVAPGVVETTTEEARAVRQLAENQGWRSLIVVTDPFHTRRARMAFHEVFTGTGIDIIVRPVEDSWYDPDSWWKSVGGLWMTWTEYLKLGLHLVGYR